MVDGVSSIGALDFQMDKWKVDIAVTGSQKALSLPTGLAVVAVSDKVPPSHRSASSTPAPHDLHRAWPHTSTRGSSQRQCPPASAAVKQQCHERIFKGPALAAVLTL